MTLQRQCMVLGSIVGFLATLAPQTAQARGRKPETPEASGDYNVPKGESVPTPVPAKETTTPIPTTPATGTPANNIPTANGLPATSNPGGSMHE